MERGLANQHLIEQHPKGPPVHGERVPQTLQDLGRTGGIQVRGKKQQYIPKIRRFFMRYFKRESLMTRALRGKIKIHLWEIVDADAELWFYPELLFVGMWPAPWTGLCSHSEIFSLNFK